MKHGEVVEKAISARRRDLPGGRDPHQFLEPGGGEDDGRPMFPYRPHGRSARGARCRHAGGDAPLADDLRRCRCAGPEGHRAAGRRQRRYRAAGALRKIQPRAVAMGLAETAEAATRDRPHTPKSHSSRRRRTTPRRAAVWRRELQLCARILSMGKLHHAMTGTGAVALAVAAAIPGHRRAHRRRPRPGRQRALATLSTLVVGAEAVKQATNGSSGDHERSAPADGRLGRVPADAIEEQRALAAE